MSGSATPGYMVDFPIPWSVQEQKRSEAIGAHDCNIKDFKRLWLYIPEEAMKEDGVEERTEDVSSIGPI